MSTSIVIFPRLVVMATNPDENVVSEFWGPPDRRAFSPAEAKAMAAKLEAQGWVDVYLRQVF